MYNPQFSSLANRKEMLNYYAIGPASEIESKELFTYDLWQCVERICAAFKIKGRRLIDIGGGLGKFSAEALKRGYDVIMVDVSEDIIKRAIALHPELKDRVYILDIFDPEATTEFIKKFGQFDIVFSLGFVVNHSDSIDKIIVALDNHLKACKGEFTIGDRY